jgi:ketosteroid isomerase-like protein
MSALHTDPTSTDAGRDAVRELASMFADALCAGDRQRIESLVSPEVIYQVPGRSAIAGVHRGADAVLGALSPVPPPGVDVQSVDITEVLVDGRRALIVIATCGVAPGGPFDHETALHLQTDGERVVAVTEYSGEQYVADALLAPRAAVGASTGQPVTTRSSKRRWWARR